MSSMSSATCSSETSPSCSATCGRAGSSSRARNSELRRLDVRVNHGMDRGELREAAPVGQPLHRRGGHHSLEDGYLLGQAGAILEVEAIEVRGERRERVASAERLERGRAVALLEEI